MRYEVPNDEGWKPAGEPQTVELESIYRGRIALYRKVERLVMPGLLMEATVKKHFLEEQPDGLTFQLIADMRNRVGRHYVNVNAGVQWCAGPWIAGSGLGPCFLDLGGADLRPRHWPPQGSAAHSATHRSAGAIRGLTQPGELLSALFGQWEPEEIRQAFGEIPAAVDVILAAAAAHGGELGELAVNTFSEEAD